MRCRVISPGQSKCQEKECLSLLVNMCVCASVCVIGLRVCKGAVLEIGGEDGVGFGEGGRVDERIDFSENRYLIGISPTGAPSQ